MISPTHSNVIEYVSDTSQGATLRRLVAFIDAAGMRIFARIDHAANARAMGAAMRPAVVLLYGHPRRGTPVMQSLPAAALELPLRLLVREGDDGRARVSFHPIAPVLQELGVAEDLVARLEPAELVLARAVGR